MQTTELAVSLSNDQLLASLKTVVSDERRLVARVLAYLAEVEERNLHLELGCSNMFAFCMQKLGFSEDQAGRRMAVAGLGRRYPQVLAAIASGRLTLSSADLLRKVITAANVDALITAASGKS